MNPAAWREYYKPIKSYRRLRNILVKGMGILTKASQELILLLKKNTESNNQYGSA